MKSMPFAYLFSTLRALPRCSMGVADTPINEVLEQFREQSVDIIDGPIERSGANGAIVSLYLIDRDGHNIEAVCHKAE
jgi:hypothetical protein